MKKLSTTQARKKICQLHGNHETLFLLSVSGMRESIRKGLKTPIEKCDKNIRW